MAGIKFSRQREAIIDYLRNTKDHPTADMVYTHVRELYPKVSLGTVYRNLNLLAEEGEILRLTQVNGPDRFDGNIEPHYHFVCNHCKQIRDLKTTSLEHINTLASVGFDGLVESHQILFYGICPICKKYQLGIDKPENL